MNEFGSDYELVACFCECGNEIPLSIKCGEFLLVFLIFISSVSNVFWSEVSKYQELNILWNYKMGVKSRLLRYFMTSKDWRSNIATVRKDLFADCNWWIMFLLYWMFMYKFYSKYRRWVCLGSLRCPEFKCVESWQYVSGSFSDTAPLWFCAEECVVQNKTLCH